MVRTALRNLLGHKIRLFTTGLAVMLGVAFMAGTLVLTDTIGKTFDDLFTDAYAGTDAMVRAEASFEDPNGFGDLRGRLDDGLLDEVAAVDGVAYDAGVTVGDEVTVLVQGAPIEATVSGIARVGGSDSPGGSTFAMFTTEAAQELVGEPGKFDSISIAAEDGVSQQEVVARVQGVVPDGIEVVTGEAVTEESQDALREGLSFFNTFLLVFAIVALLVGGFIIFNTFFITVAQRTRENALLRAIGATRRQVLAAVLLEALGIGLVAS